jgi:hypothetical protein
MGHGIKQKGSNLGCPGPFRLLRTTPYAVPACWGSNQELAAPSAFFLSFFFLSAHLRSSSFSGWPPLLMKHTHAHSLSHLIPPPFSPPHSLPGHSLPKCYPSPPAFPFLPFFLCSVLLDLSLCILVRSHSIGSSFLSHGKIFPLSWSPVMTLSLGFRFFADEFSHTQKNLFLRFSYWKF